uniref:Actin interacting protein 3-like C-terminal domain-containing protein n=1 Tax=Romanomermis culicivorax TaxID=13658 RepID=A0A915J0X0_ROMCU
MVLAMNLVKRIRSSIRVKRNSSKKSSENNKTTSSDGACGVINEENCDGSFVNRILIFFKLTIYLVFVLNYFHKDSTFKKPINQKLHSKVFWKILNRIVDGLNDLVRFFCDLCPESSLCQGKMFDDKKSAPIKLVPFIEKEGVVESIFLNFGDETKRITLPNDLETIEDVRHLFYVIFADSSDLERLHNPNAKVYIQDQNRPEIFYELEDLHDIKPKCVLKLHEHVKPAFTHPGSLSTNNVVSKSAANLVNQSKSDDLSSCASETASEPAYQQKGLLFHFAYPEIPYAGSTALCASTKRKQNKNVIHGSSYVTTASFEPPTNLRQNRRFNVVPETIFRLFLKVKQLHLDQIG